MDQHLATYIDHTLLKPDATAAAIVALCKEAEAYGFASVCVNPYWVKKAAEQLAGTNVKVCTVIGFPLGCTPAEVKAAEVKQALADGATELDMVMNLGAFKSGDEQAVQADIQAVVAAAEGRTVKVILEVGYLSEEEIVKACELAQAAGAHFVKTSTGFGPGGATPNAISLMHQTVGTTMEVKASGGVRDLAFAKELIQLGATRIGTSSGVAIVQGEEGSGGY